MGWLQFESTEHLVVGEREVSLRFWTIETTSEREEARKLIAQEHYLSAPNRGRFLACSVADSSEEAGAPMSIIGCAVIDSLTFGNPLGRAAIASLLGIGPEWQQWSRGEIVSTMGIAWVSRFAVAKPYQGLGVGKLLGQRTPRRLQNATEFHPRRFWRLSPPSPKNAFCQCPTETNVETSCRKRAIVDSRPQYGRKKSSKFSH